MSGPDLRAGSFKDDFLGSELTGIAWYRRKHQWGDGAVRRSASLPSTLATYGKVEFHGYSSGLQSPRGQDTQPRSSSLKGVHCCGPSQAGSLTGVFLPLDRSPVVLFIVLAPTRSPLYTRRVHFLFTWWEAVEDS